MEIDIATRQDLREAKNEILEEIKKILGEKNKQTNITGQNWLRSAQVRQILGISPGTLQNLRISGTLPYRKIGGTMYYRSNDIDIMMEGRSGNG